MRKLVSFYDAWWFLAEHPKFNHLKDGVPDARSGFFDNIDVYVAKVDPKTRIVEKDKSRNTEVEIWLEAGPWVPVDEQMGKPETYSEMPSHDIRLDCGGKTYEKAIIKMAKLVLRYYGDY